MSNFAPMNEMMIDASLQSFGRVSAVVSGLAVVIYTARVSMLAAFVGNPAQYAAAVKELVAYFAALALFGPLFKIVVLTTGQVSSHLAAVEITRDVGVLDKLTNDLKSSTLLYLATQLGPMSVTYLAQAIYSLLLGTLCAVAPVVLLFQLISGSTSGLQVLGGSILTLCSWPIVWNAIGLLANQLWPSFAETSLAGVCFWFGVKLLQMLSPLFAGMLLKNFSMNGTTKSIAMVTLVRKAVIKK